MPGIISGFIFIGLGCIGLALEIENYITNQGRDFFGIVLALFFITAGFFFFFLGRRARQKKKKGSPPMPVNRPQQGLAVKAAAPGRSPAAVPGSGQIKAIAVTGIILSALVLVAALLLIIYGQIFISVLYNKAESGWGFLGIGLFILGILILGLASARLTAYILLWRMQKSGWLLVIMVESLSLIYRIYFVINSFTFLLLLPLLWGVGVIIYLILFKSSFR
ncbi:MAG TPA: hypothetical protein VKS21_05885 [Spirochaetota bacterium]|nr:hypothetical protein [Spirochaetota bacterium]